MRVMAMVAAAVVLGSCTTPEYRAERDICSAEWLKRIPPLYERQTVNRIRYEQRPTGVTHCTTTGTTTTCVDEMRSVAIPYVSVETVDVNAGRRKTRIDACAAQACLARYGNTTCEAPGA
ncbi:MAG: hypothetical protein H5U20_09365 [Rhodobacteraceae bacterium]|nr:hypothetical protein [Paracoccaceae bacterium]